MKCRSIDTRVSRKKPYISCSSALLSKRMFFLETRVSIDLKFTFDPPRNFSARNYSTLFHVLLHSGWSSLVSIGSLRFRWDYLLQGIIGYYRGLSYYFLAQLLSVGCQQASTRNWKFPFCSTLLVLSVSETIYLLFSLKRMTFWSIGMWCRFKLIEFTHSYFLED